MKTYILEIEFSWYFYTFESGKVLKDIFGKKSFSLLKQNFLYKILSFV